MKKNKLWLNRCLLVLIFFPLLVLAEPPSKAAGELTLTEVVFEEVEPGLEPYVSRLLLGKQFMRLDGGDDQGDFVLFNRKTHEIHSFNHEEQTHLLMKPLTPEKLDFELNFKIETKDLTDAPKIQGVTAVQHSFYADLQLCKSSFNVAGMLPEVTRALIDYEQAIVEQNKRSFDRIPASVRSSCYMANNYLHASAYLMAGFPLFVMDDQQRGKKVTRFGVVKKPQSLFIIPQGYKLYHPNESNL